MNPGETVESIIYGRNGGTTAYRNLPCGLQIQTNLRKSESFSWSNPCPPVYRVDIPPETPLEIFFKDNVKIITKWGMNWFDGFTSEYNTETTSSLVIHNAAVLDRLEFNGVQYGRSNGGTERIVEFGQNEVVKEFQYHKTAWWWIDTLCSFTIITNIKTHHVDGFEEWKAVNPDGRYGYCGSELFSVKVPRLEFSKISKF